MTELIPLRQIFKEFQELDNSLETYYFDVWCRFCGHKIEESEYDSHNCASRQLVRAYYREME